MHYLPVSTITHICIQITQKHTHGKSRSREHIYLSCILVTESKSLLLTTMLTYKWWIWLITTQATVKQKNEGGRVKRPLEKKQKQNQNQKKLEGEQAEDMEKQIFSVWFVWLHIYLTIRNPNSYKNRYKWRLGDIFRWLWRWNCASENQSSVHVVTDSQQWQTNTNILSVPRGHIWLKKKKQAELFVLEKNSDSTCEQRLTSDV